MAKKKTVKQQTVSLKKKVTAKKKGWVAPGAIKKPGQKIPAGILKGMDKKKGKKK